MAAIIAAVLAAVLVVGTGALWLGQRSLIYFPDRSAPPPAGAVLPGARDVVVRTDDGLDLGAYHVPPRPGCAATVLVAQGNGGNRGGRAPLALALAERGLGVLLVDYRGYGGNPGSPTEDGLARDIRAARRYLVQDAAVPPDRLVYLGESLGAAVAAELATEHPPAALVLRSPFPSLAAAGEAAYGVPVGALVQDRYDVSAAVRQVRVPTAVVSGTADTIVPARLSQEVARASADPDVLEVEVEGAGHNDAVLAHGPALVDAVMAVTARAGIPGCG